MVLFNSPLDNFQSTSTKSKHRIHTDTFSDNLSTDLEWSSTSKLIGTSDERQILSMAIDKAYAESLSADTEKSLKKQEIDW